MDSVQEINPLMEDTVLISLGSRPHWLMEDTVLRSFEAGPRRLVEDTVLRSLLFSVWPLCIIARCC